MLRKRIVSVCFAIALFNAIPIEAPAQIIGGAKGDAAEWVEWGCHPCCFVKNRSAKRIDAGLAHTLGAVIVRAFPGDTKYFYFGGACLTGGWVLSVKFVPDDQP